MNIDAMIERLQEIKENGAGVGHNSRIYAEVYGDLITLSVDNIYVDFDGDIIIDTDIQ